MSSEQLADGVNPLDAELAATWDVLKGYSGRDTDLGIARRFGGAAAAYSLRNIGSDGLPVVRVRRDSDDTEEDFSANQVASGALETFVIDGATQKGLDQSTWQNTGAESFTSTSTDGFSYSNSSSTAFIGVTLSETLALNDSVFISFNASGVTHPSSSDQSPQVRLRDSVSGGSGTSPINQVVNGFNAYTLTYNTGSSGQHIVFSEGDTAGGTVTISDFKVFGVSRNGFVETWYDQSGNGEDMTQGTAGKQPSIVLNGGQVKDYNGNNSIDFVSGSTRVLDKSGTTTAKTCIVVLDEDSSGSSERAILGFSDSTSFMRLDTTTDLEVKAGGGTANYRAISADTTSLYFWYTNGTDEDKLFENNVEISDTLSYTPPNLPFTRIGARNSDADPYNSRITEVIAFAEDLSSDRTVLQDNVNNNYNIF